MTSSHPQGSEEKDGSGKCSCKRGYEGDTCQQCAKGFFNDTEEEEFTCEGWFRLKGKTHEDVQFHIFIIFGV